MRKFVAYKKEEEQAIIDFIEKKITKEELLLACPNRNIQTLSSKAYNLTGSARGFGRKIKGSTIDRGLRRQGEELVKSWPQKAREKLGQKLSGREGFIRVEELSVYFNRPINEIVAVSEFLFDMGEYLNKMVNPDEVARIKIQAMRDVE